MSCICIRRAASHTQQSNISVSEMVNHKITGYSKVNALYYIKTLMSLYQTNYAEYIFVSVGTINIYLLFIYFNIQNT